VLSKFFEDLVNRINKEAGMVTANRYYDKKLKNIGHGKIKKKVKTTK
jgi:hypothetical protein